MVYFLNFSIIFPKILNFSIFLTVLKKNTTSFVNKIETENNNNSISRWCLKWGVKEVCPKQTNQNSTEPLNWKVNSIYAKAKWIRIKNTYSNFYYFFFSNFIQCLIKSGQRPQLDHFTLDRTLNGSVATFIRKKIL